MHQFGLVVRRKDSAGVASLQAVSTSGASIGTSADGSTSVAILGLVGRDADAARAAESYVSGDRDPTSIDCRGVAAAVLDHLSGTMTTIAAPIGSRQVFWSTVDDEFHLSSDPRTLRTQDGEDSSIRLDAIFHYVYFHMLPGPGSAFAGVAKLDGGHWVRWNGKAATVARYWQPRFDDRPQMSEAEACHELHDLLRKSVARSLGERAQAGAFLSGGLDSSTVAGFASQLRPGIPTISMGFDAEGYDEMEYARIASRHFGTRALEYYVTPADVLQALPLFAAAFPEPFGNSSAAAVYHCARVARENGLDLLLAGDGGDEIFGGNQRYATQLVFERYSLIPAALRTRLLEPLASAVGGLTHAFPVGKVLSYIQKANVPLPDRLQAYNFLHRHDPAEVFEPDFLEQVDIAEPMCLLRKEYDVPDTGSAVNRMLFLDWKFTLHDNDLVKVNAMCQLAGIDVAYPMLDQEVVDFSLRLPGDWKVRNGRLRWFYKRAMQDFLPREIIAKTKHGFGLPFGVWTRTHEGLRRLSEDALESLGRRGYIRPQFIREALRLHREGHAAYYGELVWVLMVLELWLAAQARAPTLEPR